MASLFVLALGGCVTPDLRLDSDPVAAEFEPDDLDFAPFNRQPRARVGSIPARGAFTLWKVADPARLGQHRYSAGVLGASEAARGIVYTTRGGFLDIAHLRKAADWTAYHHARIRFALEHGWSGVVLPCKEPSVYRLRFQYPSFWPNLSSSRKQRVIDELAIRLAQRLAITQTTWHEIATWYGYSSTPISEAGSAFTYDDTPSHVLGAIVAGMALRDRDRSYDEAVTHHLKRELDRLGAVKPAQTRQAVDAVKGEWWANGRVTKRHLDIGAGDGVVDAWLVPGFASRRVGRAERFEIPSLRHVAGMDLRGFEELTIEPRMAAWARMRSDFPDKPDRCNPAIHFPLLMAKIRAEANALASSGG